MLWPLANHGFKHGGFPPHALVLHFGPFDWVSQTFRTEYDSSLAPIMLLSPKSYPCFAKILAQQNAAEPLTVWYEPGSKLLVLGMVIQPLIGNPCNGYINPYYKVDDHPLLYGNNGSLDPSTFESLPPTYNWGHWKGFIRTRHPRLDILALGFGWLPKKRGHPKITSQTSTFYINGKNWMSFLGVSKNSLPFRQCLLLKSLTFSESKSQIPTSKKGSLIWS